MLLQKKGKKLNSDSSCDSYNEPQVASKVAGSVVAKLAKKAKYSIYDISEVDENEAPKFAQSRKKQKKKTAATTMMMMKLGASSEATPPIKGNYKNFVKAEKR